MCGLAGLILGPRRRTAKRLASLAAIFKAALRMCEERGEDASGVALLSLDGAFLFKRPVPAGRLLDLSGCEKLLAGLNSRSTALLGHARKATVGDPLNNANNHPIVAGPIVGAHNGTIENADKLAMAWGLPRTAEVDSEIFFRTAEMAIFDDKLDARALRKRLRRFKGEMASVFASMAEPDKTYLVKGGKPLAARYNPELDAVVFASRRGYLPEDWEDLPLPPMTMATIDRRRLDRIAYDRI